MSDPVSLPGFAAYPSITSTIDTDFGVVSDLSSDGVLYQRGLYADEYYVLALDWGPLNNDDYQALVAFFAAYRQTEIAVDFAGEQYVGRLSGQVSASWTSGVTNSVRATLRCRKTSSQIASIIASYNQASVWYDPSDLSTVWQDTAGTIPAVPGLQVARIDDKGNLGLHATQSNPSYRPTLQRDNSGHYYLQFDGIDDYMNIPTGMPVPTAGVCAIGAWRHDGYPSSTPIIYYQRGVLYDKNHRHPIIFVESNDSTNCEVGHYYSASVVGSTPPGNCYVSTCYLGTDNASGKQYLNGVLVYISNVMELGDALDSPIGSIGHSTFAGAIYGIVHIQHGIADVDRRTIERWLMRKTGMA